MRAVVENHPDSSNLPPIQVTITKGEEDIVIRVNSRYLAALSNLVFYRSRIINTLTTYISF